VISKGLVPLLHGPLRHSVLRLQCWVPPAAAMAPVPPVAGMGSATLADSVASSARSAAISGRGTGFGVKENVWTRELTEESPPRVYYYNRATGSSQWHLPTDMYDTGGFTHRSETGRVTEAGAVVWPTFAKATLRVDCVTEVLEPSQLEPNPPSSSSSAAGAVSIIEADPRNLVKIYERVPVFLAELLRSDQFDDMCVQTFKGVAENGELQLIDAINPVIELVGKLEHPQIEQPLAVSEDRALRLASRFNKDDSHLSTLDLQDFVDFVRFAVAVRFLEVAMGLDD